jgi:hypothetical protein
MEKELFEISQENESLQIQVNIVPKNDHENVNKRLQVLHAHRLFWKPYGRNAQFLAFNVVNDNTQIDGKVLHVMHWMICHNEYDPFIARTKLKNRFISYFKSNGITTFKKHVDVKHTLITKKFKEEVNSIVKNGLEKQLAKK